MDNSEKLAMLDQEIADLQATLDIKIAERNRIADIQAQAEQDAKNAKGYSLAISNMMKADVVETSPDKSIVIAWGQYIFEGLYYTLNKQVYKCIESGIVEPGNYKTMLTLYTAE